MSSSAMVALMMVIPCSPTAAWRRRSCSQCRRRRSGMAPRLVTLGGLPVKRPQLFVLHNHLFGLWFADHREAVGEGRVMGMGGFDRVVQERILPFLYRTGHWIADPQDEHCHVALRLSLST